MAEKDPSPSRRAFEHLSTERKPPMVELHCPFCRCFIAASSNPKMVALAQSCHSCPESLQNMTRTR
jgi:hypothetical protein